VGQAHPYRGTIFLLLYLFLFLYQYVKDRFLIEKSKVKVENYFVSFSILNFQLNCGE
jgi:hypothetical protein